MSSVDTTFAIVLWAYFAALVCLALSILNPFGRGLGIEGRIVAGLGVGVLWPLLVVALFRAEPIPTARTVERKP